MMPETQHRQTHQVAAHETQARSQTPATAPGTTFWLLMAFSIVAVGGLAYLQYERVDRARRGEDRAASGRGLPVLGTVPDFHLIERSGKPVTLADLTGTIWVADFIFTHCGGPCPLMTRRMRDLHESLNRENLSRVRTVSITVDPERDTPSALTEYATMHQADDHDWYFLTGERDRIYDLSVNCFKLTARPEDGTDQIIHSPRFALIDGRGRIRGYYEAVTDEEIEALPRAEVIDKPMAGGEKRRLIGDIRRLLSEGGR